MVFQSETSSLKPLRIIIHSVDGTGHMNACIGLAQGLAKRGHRIQFLINAAFKGQFSLFGFEEIFLFDQPKPKPKDEEAAASPADVNPIKVMAEQLKSSGMIGGANSLEKLKMTGKNSTFVEDILHKAVEFNPQIGDVLARELPDAIVIDHMLIPPAIPQANIPYILIFSGNPLLIHGSPQLPPAFSGFAANSDPSTWTEFQKVFDEFFFKVMLESQSRLNAHFNYKPADLPENFRDFPHSPYLKIYGYPKELDYQDIVPNSSTVAQVDAFCRETPEPFVIPEELNVKPGDKLIYVSMGSMGSIDVELNQRIAAALAKTPYKCIFSKGPLADEYKLPDNCWGEAFLPQTRILPLVDLVITHGGNNTVTEAFSFGKPMIVMPLFGDQYDNAQRIQEKCFGARIEPYSFEEQELIHVINRLINDDVLKQKLTDAAKRIETSNSKEKACLRIEQVIEEFRSK